MSYVQVLELGRDLFYTVLLLALPTLAISLLVGLLVSIFQAVTSIQDQTLSYVPRLVAVGLVILFTMGWAIQLAVHFTIRVLWQAAEVTH
jgi:flagellar biosynthetic protein FliQ